MPVYPSTWAKYSLSTYLRMVSSTILTPGRDCEFSIITATVFSLTLVATVVPIYFRKEVRFMAYRMVTIFSQSSLEYPAPGKNSLLLSSGSSYSPMA